MSAVKDAIPTKADIDRQPSFLSVKETASHLRLCEKQVRRLIGSGELVGYRFGTALRIRREDIDVYVASCRIKAKARN